MFLYPRKIIPVENSQSIKDPVIEINQQLIDLEMQKNFWKNKIKLVDQDHFNIFINLSDSLISLEMNGITAHRAQVLNFDISESLRLQRQRQDIVKMLSEPLDLLDVWASIPKEPIRVKDISGYKWNPDSLSFVPDHFDTAFVFIVIKCSKNFSIMISQRTIIGNMPSYLTSDPMTGFDFSMKNKDKTGELPFAPLLQNNWIGIVIPRSDAIVFFRALMEKSSLILSL
jgi:hypothetical protein